jgi:hypothetical protein
MTQSFALHVIILSSVMLVKMTGNQKEQEFLSVQYAMYKMNPGILPEKNQISEIILNLSVLPEYAKIRIKICSLMSI